MGVICSKVVMKIRALFLAWMVGASWAHAGIVQPNKGLVRFSSELTQEVTNDQIEVHLYYQTQHKDASSLSAHLTARHNQAQSIAKGFGNITLESAQNSHYPTYNDAGKPTGFTGRTGLILRGADFDAVSAAISALAGVLEVSDVRFLVSDAKIQATKYTLARQNIQKFLQDAAQIAQDFGAQNYALQEVQIDSNGGGYTPVPMMAFEGASLAKTAPIFETGTTVVRHRIEGGIYLLP